MAEALKDQLNGDVVRAIADNLAEAAAAHGSPIDPAALAADCLAGLDDLELTPRAQHIADVMAAHLPGGAAAIEIVTTAITDVPTSPVDDQPQLRGEPNHPTKKEVVWGASIWFFLPHSRFIVDHGPEHYELAMTANYELTQRFTAEFSIRPFIETQPDRTFERLAEWVDDPSAHVRRLVSEGTRSRLPWARRLRNVQADPAPVLALLEQLRDDPSEYVRRSVANNLNDIAKDHPEVVVEVARHWWPAEAHTPEETNRRRLVRHALRTLIKAGDPAALAVMGFDSTSTARVTSLTVTPNDPAIGDKVRIEVTVENPPDAPADAGALVDLAIDFVKANGTTSAKVFKGAERWLAPGESATVRKTVSLAQHSTRTHHPGHHPVRALLNGETVTEAAFDLRE